MTYLASLPGLGAIAGDALAPAHLGRWLGCGQLIGIGKVDPQGNLIPLDPDARPIVMGVTWRKSSFKCSLVLDKQSIRDKVPVGPKSWCMLHAIGSTRIDNETIMSFTKRHQE